MMSTRPEDEGQQLLQEVATALRHPQRDVKLALRTFAQACTILSWGEHLQWAQRELNGYPEGTELPWYRQNVPGLLDWKTDELRAAATSAVTGKRFPEAQSISIDVRGGISWLTSAASTGYIERTGRTDAYWGLSERFSIYERRWFPAESYQRVIAAIEEQLFSYASGGYAALRYGASTHIIWEGYRADVDQKLADLGLSGHLLTINRGLESSNPQNWRAALWSCRDALHDVAKYLWRDPRTVYVHLPGAGPGGKLSVTESDYVNRLGAYLHQKGAQGTSGAYIRAEMERIYGSIRTLNSLASTAHSGVTLEDARTAAVGTYFIIGELVRRTDMVPIEHYSDESPS